MKNIQERLSVYMSLESGIAIAVIIALFVYVISGYAPFAQYLLMTVVILGIMPLVYEIAQSVVHKEFGVDLIALVAILSSLVIGEYTAAGLILLMLSGGEGLERFAENRARGSLERLIAGAPTVAHKIVGDHVIDCAITDVVIGDVVLVKQREIVPVDGVVIDGSGSLDESMITGEPLPRDVHVHDRVFSGSVNGDTLVRIRVDATHQDSTYATIVRLVKKSEEQKAPMVRLADRYSVVFTAITLVLSGAAYALFGAHTAVAVLVVATPCPLILAAPIAFIAGMSRAAQRGIIVKHGGVFEGVAGAKAFFFDKTGTLTFGTPRLISVVPLGGISEADVLRFAGSLEQLSTHIIARSVMAAAREKNSDLAFPEQFKETFGKGVVGTIDGHQYAIGKKAFLHDVGVTVSDAVQAQSDAIKAKGGICVLLSKDTAVVGLLEFEDVVRSSVADTLSAVSTGGKKTVLVTGDTKVRTEQLTKTLHFSEVYAECLPEDKVAHVVASEKRGEHVVMIGDGVNDAPALAAARVGIAFGSHGETASTDTADVVMLVDDFDRVKDVVRISEGTMRIAKESIFAGIGLSVLAMLVALSGNLPPTYGALVQEVIDVVVILNALRVLRV